MPRRFRILLYAVAALALLPFACVYKARHSLSPLPRIHLLQGMDNQPRFRSQQANPLFADLREERPPVPGTVARGRLDDDEARMTGARDGRDVDAFPVRVSGTLLARGRERFDIYCSPCHGLAGDGDGIVAVRADRLREGTWVQPTSLHDPTVLARPVGHIYKTITHGIRTMPSYGAQIPVDDRWAIVAYVRALQRAAHAPVARLSAEERAALRDAAP